MSGGANGQAAYSFGRVAELRSAAMALAGHGWPVLRGTYPDGVRWHGRDDAVGLRPVDDHWSVAWTLSRAEVARWWANEPFGVLVACGHGVDCIELPGSAGHRMLGPLREAGLHPPAMVTPVGTVVLFVRTHTGVRPVLTSVSLRSAGSWVAVPPTSGYRWLAGSTPAAVQWQLPELRPVYEVIAANVRAVITNSGNEPAG